MPYSKGISPLLATVLLIAATVVVSTMVAGWLTSTTSATQAVTYNKTNEGVACAAAEIVIDDVYTGAGSGSIARTIVRNSGGTDNLAITSAQLYDKFGNNFTTTNSLPTNLNKGQVATLSFNYSILPTTTNDSSHGINNGTLVNGASYSLGGKYGGGISLDGTDDYVNASDANYQFISNFTTTELWLKADSMSDWKIILEKAPAVGDLSEPRISFDASNPRKFQFWYNFPVGYFTLTSITTPSLNTWYHVAVGYNSTHGYIYVNGILENITANNTGLRPNTVPYMLIGKSLTSANTFDGTIDDAAIWNRSLTNAEINTSMNIGPTAVSNTNDLVGYWKFDEGKGILSCPSDFSRVVVTTNCGGVSAEFSKAPKC